MTAMTIVANGRPAVDPGEDQPTVIPAQHGERAIGAYVVQGGAVRFVPAFDLTYLALGGAACVAAAAFAFAAAAGRHRPAIGALSMGPGGWVSLKNATAPALRPAAGRPWWARLLRAHRLVVEHG